MQLRVTRPGFLNAVQRLVEDATVVLIEAAYWARFIRCLGGRHCSILGVGSTV
jgi:hypothetical protein